MNAKELKAKFFTEFLPEFEAVKTSDSDEIALKKLLNFLYYFQENWTFIFDDDFWFRTDKDVTIKVNVFKHISDEEQKSRIIKKMIEDGYSGGCDCGCRGDFCITDKGLGFIGKERVLEYGGY